MQLSLFALFASAVNAAPVNYGLGTQAIYGPNWKAYNFSELDVLREQVQGIAAMGGNQLKIRLAPDSTCKGYRLSCSGHESSLAELTQQSSVAAALAHDAFVWYQIWLYSFSNPNFLKRDWTEAALQQEYQETKDWAGHMLRTYAGTGKVFMAGNWEGDWMLMEASGCKKDGHMDMGCDPTPEVLQRMVLWGRTRQRAIDDARREARAEDVWIYYYMEMNLGPQAQGGKPGLTNDVLSEVNPDLVSYSSYSATNAFEQTDDVAAVEKAFVSVMDYVNSKLPSKEVAGLKELGFLRRVFVGEFGAHASKSPTEFEVNRFVSRVAAATLAWGAPFVLYWEFYSTYDTVPIVPPEGPKTGLQRLFEKYYAAAAAFVKAHAPAPEEFRDWAEAYFRAPERASCDFQEGVGFSAPGFAFPAESKERCCELCGMDPSCAVGVFDGKACYMKAELWGKLSANGIACVKQRHQAVTV